MDLQVAKAAGELAAKIEARQARLAEIQALGEGWRVSALRVSGPNGDLSLLVDELDPSTTAVVIGHAIQIYEAQLKALNEALAALGQPNADPA